MPVTTTSVTGCQTDVESVTGRSRALYTPMLSWQEVLQRADICDASEWAELYCRSS